MRVRRSCCSPLNYLSENDGIFRPTPRQSLFVNEPGYALGPSHGKARARMLWTTKMFTSSETRARKIEKYTLMVLVHGYRTLTSGSALAASVAITFCRASKDFRILFPSASWSPFVPAFLALSDPARSTNFTLLKVASCFLSSSVKTTRAANFKFAELSSRRKTHRSGFESCRDSSLSRPLLYSLTLVLKVPRTLEMT